MVTEVVQQAADKAQRALRMARILADGGFGDEAAAAARGAVLQAAGALYLFAEGAGVEDALEPLTDAMVAAIRRRADLDRSRTGLLQAAHLGLDADPAAFLQQAADFADYCTEPAEKEATRISANLPERGAR